MRNSLLLGLLALFVAAPQTPAATPAKPNVLIFIADDMGYSDIGCYGGEIQTPNLDRLAAGGLRFTQFYNTARCWPTRAALMTGYYAQQINADPNKGMLPNWTRTLPQYLKPLGYRSYHSGKWHINGAPRALADGGFDRSFMLNDHNRNFTPRSNKLDDQPLPPVKPEDHYYSTTAVASHAIDFLKQHAAEHKDQPFFSYVAFTCPHFPLHAPPEDIAKYEGRYTAGWDALRDQRLKRMRELGIHDGGLSARQPDLIPSSSQSAEELTAAIGPGEAPRAVAWAELTSEQKELQAIKMSIHAAMVDRMDQEIGRVLKQVEAMGQTDNTVVMFLSDNGASAEELIRGDGHDPKAAPGSAASFLCLGPGFSTACNTPFRLHKIWTHEGGISTPFIISWPRGIAARGEIRHDQGHVIDIAPTVLQAVGGQWLPEKEGHKVVPFPGLSLFPAFTADKALSRDYLFFSHSGNGALRKGDWKLVSLDTAKDQWELYDLSKDRVEMNNLATKEAERAKAMAAEWHAKSDLFAEQAGPPERPAKGKANREAGKGAGKKKQKDEEK